MYVILQAARKTARLFWLRRPIRMKATRHLKGRQAFVRKPDSLDDLAPWNCVDFVNAFQRIDPGRAVENDSAEHSRQGW